MVVVVKSFMLSSVTEDGPWTSGSAAKNNQELLFKPGGPGASLEWTVVRPGGLTQDPANGVINVVKGEAGSISRADVAAFCLDAVMKDDWEYVRQYPCISSDKGTSWVKDRVGGNVDRMQAQ